MWKYKFKTNKLKKSIQNSFLNGFLLNLGQFFLRIEDSDNICFLYFYSKQPRTTAKNFVLSLIDGILTHSFTVCISLNSAERASTVGIPSELKYAPSVAPGT